MSDEKIMEALRALDVNDNAHWTSKDLPSMEAVEKLSGLNPTREDVTRLAPDFTRKNPLPAVTQNPSNQGGGSDDDNDGTNNENTESEENAEKAEAEQRLTEAKRNFESAKKEHSEAVKAMDAILRKEAKTDARQSKASDIKAFQRSQAEQRVKNTENANEVAALIKERGLGNTA